MNNVNCENFLGNFSVIFFDTVSHVVREIAVATYRMIFRSLNNTPIDLDTWDLKITNSHRQEHAKSNIYIYIYIYSLVDFFSWLSHMYY